jgi:hypothetical protein
LIFWVVLATALSIVICAFDTPTTQAMPKVQDPVHQIPADRSGICSTTSGSQSMLCISTCVAGRDMGERSIEAAIATQTVTATTTAYVTIRSTEIRIIASGVPHSIVPQTTIETKTFHHTKHHLSVVLEVTTVRNMPPLQTEVSCSWSNVDGPRFYHYTYLGSTEKCEMLKRNLEVGVRGRRTSVTKQMRDQGMPQCIVLKVRGSCTEF